MCLLFCVYFFFVHFDFHPSPQKKSDLYASTSNSCIFTPIENWTHVYMNLFTRNRPYYHLLKYLLFLLKHPVCYNKISLLTVICNHSVIFSPWSNILKWATTSSLSRIHDHTQRRTTVGRTPLDERSARRRDLYLTTHNTHN